ncbi:MAG: response regulator [Bacteroidales bacterium]|nr:response regulator [Bacteroidales bacterium]
MICKLASLLMTSLLVVGTAWPKSYTASRHVSMADGLANDGVLEMTIDGMGYVWVATEAGVSRIAGNTCTSLRWPDGSGPIGQRVAALYWHESSGQMMIGTELGLVLYRLSTGEISILDANDGMVMSSVEDIARASDDEVWLVYGRGDVQRLNVEKRTFVSLPLVHPLQNRCLLDDGQGRLYIGHSQHGLSMVSLTGGITRHFEQESQGQGLPGNNVRCIYLDDRQRVWVGTDGGLALFNPASGTFTRVTLDADDYDDNVYDIVQMRDGTLWVATDMGGIKVVNPDTYVAYSALPIADTDDGIRVKVSSLNTRSLVQDEYGNIWVGNHSTGVDFISAERSQFDLLDYLDHERLHRPVYAMTPDTNRGFWMASDDELVLWFDGKVQGCWSGQNQMRRRHSLPRCMMTDSSGRVWMGIDDEGVICFSRATGRFERVAIEPEGADVHSFYEDPQHRIWIGGEFGVYLYQQGTVLPCPTITHALNAPVTGFLPIDQHRLLLTTLGDRAYIFDQDSDTCLPICKDRRLLPSKINQAIRDLDGRTIWLATDEGLTCITDITSSIGITTYGRQQGLSDSHVLALQQDADGRIWMSTYTGITCFDKRTGQCYNYSQTDIRGVRGFAPGAALVSNDGIICFGSASGVCCFDPRRVVGSTPVSDVQIVSCEAYHPKGMQTEILPLTPDRKGQVHTSYRQNTLHISFTVRNFAQAEHVEYSYMMQGMDDKWYDIAGDDDVVFRGLRPGHYVFVLRAKLRSQDWDEARLTQLAITITPPLWRTWWAFLVYALALAAFVIWMMSSYKRRLALQNSLEFEKRESLQKQELNEERLRFFTNVTHELRTPLTLILGPIDDLMNDTSLPPTAHRRVAMLQKSAGRLRDLINEILEFRKTETQNRRLTVARGDIGQFVREICLNYKELNRNPKVQFSYNIEPDLPRIYFDSEVITTILNNLLSNAVKYTEQGSITVDVNADDEGQLHITVADTGHGIAPDALPHIFKRYYQAEGSHQASGTGIGLALVRSLVDLHEGTISVESREGEGSRFVFSLSTDNTYPNALHKEDVAIKIAERGNEDETMADELSDETTDNQQPTLLIVEDNTDIRQYITDSFGDDFQILQAENGEEGVTMALEHIPDVIVSDIMMPHMNGIELTQRLKDDIRTSHIPIILLTAKVTDADKEEGYDSGADSYLTKPFTAKLLASRIQNLLTARRRLAEHFAHGEPLVSQAEAPALSRLDQQFFERLDKLIEDNIMQEDLDMAFVSDRMAMSHSTFYRKVKALTGMTAKEYVRKRRLRYCYGLLQSGEYNVSQAAMMTGFNQMAHFRETFKREFGILPSEVFKKKSN